MVAKFRSLLRTKNSTRSKKHHSYRVSKFAPKSSVRSVPASQSDLECPLPPKSQLDLNRKFRNPVLVEYRRFGKFLPFVSLGRTNIAHAILRVRYIAAMFANSLGKAVLAIDVKGLSLILSVIPMNGQIILRQPLPPQ